jgi:hypothetical protein
MNFKQSMIDLKEKPQEAIYLHSFGTRKMEPAHVCDINSMLTLIPQFVKDEYLPTFNEIEKLITEDIGYTWGCSETERKCRVSHKDGMEWAKDPDIVGLKHLAYFIVGDVGHALKNIKQTAEIGERLRALSDKLNTEDSKNLAGKETQARINNEIKTYWKERWFQAYAWDFDKDERTFLDNPFD